MVGVGKQGIGCTDFNYAPQIHNDHAIAQMFHHAQIMANKQISQIELFAQINKQIEYLRLDRNI